MNLHENKDIFTAAIQLASTPKQEGGLSIKQIYIEKDYWICRSLKQLSECKESEAAVFKTDFSSLFSSDQARFKEPDGWCDKKVSDSPLISSFDKVWSELQETYSKELPELAYQTIPSPESVAESFKELSVLLK